MTVGNIVPSLATDIPRGFLELNGQTVNASNYPKLAEYMGVTSATFTLPNLTDCSLGGAGTSSYGFASHENGANGTIGNATLQNHTHTVSTWNVYYSMSASNQYNRSGNIDGAANPSNMTNYGKTVSISSVGSGTFRDSCIYVKMLICTGEV